MERDVNGLMWICGVEGGIIGSEIRRLDWTFLSIWNGICFIDLDLLELFIAVLVGYFLER